MKKKLLLIAIIAISSLVSKAQTTTAFRKNYNQALFDLPGNIVEGVTPNTYVMAGTNLTFIPIYGTVTELNDTGAINWSYRYSDASIGFQLNDIKKDAGLSQYYACGGSESNAAVFMVVDVAGNIVIQKRFRINEADGAWFNRVIKAADGGYVAVGYVTGHDPDGAGPEIKFNPITYTDNNGDSQTDYIASPLIVKLDAAGNHVWHKVFRYYQTSNIPANRIYNDASFVDVTEVSDGYVAVGSYDIANHRVVQDSDGDDASPTDALILKTSTAGVITYHKQIDNPSTSTSQSSKYLSAISTTSSGAFLTAGTDNLRELIQKFNGPGASLTNTVSRLWTYSTTFFVTDPVDISQVYEVNGGTDIITMAMYIKPLSFFANSIHRVNSTSTSNVFGKRYDFNLISILPRGSKTSDNGYISMSMTAGGTNYDYHVIKTDPNGDTPNTGCPAGTFTPSGSAGPTTFADPFYNSWSGTVPSQAIAIVRTSIAPTVGYVCTKVACVAPAAPVVGAITQPTCSTPTGSVALGGLPSSGTWTVNASPGGATATGTGTTGTISGLAAGTTYTFTVTVVAGCPSVASGSATINAAPVVPAAPTIGTITQPTCSTATGSVALSGLPSSGTWTVTGTPSGTATGTGTTTTISGLAPGTYTFTVSNGTCTSTSSVNAVINTQPTVPSAPVVGAITQPTCATPTGSVALSGLPSSGTWTVTATPGGSTATGTGTTGNITGLAGGTTYTFTVSNGTCTSTSSTNAIINTAPVVPTAPSVGTITQPTCSTATGSVALSGLPSSGTWTVTGTPSGSATGTGTTTTISGLAAGTYTFTVSNGTCSSTSSINVVINTQPPTPAAPIVGTITQPTCATPTGSVALSSLPSSGTWTVTASPGGATSTGTGTTGNITGLAPGTTYTFTVSNGTCTSSSSTTAVINNPPPTPVAPAIGTITQPTCTTPTGDVALSGLPSSGTWTVTVSPGGATSTGTGTTTTITGLTAGNTYTFTVTVAGCTSSSSTSATINAPPSAPSAPVVGTITQPTCSVSTGDVALSGLPSSGTWTITTSPGGATTTGTGTSTTITGLAPGTYTFTVNDGSCTSGTSSSATINSFPGAPTAPILGTITQPTCAVGTASVVLNGLPSSGTWTVTTTPGGATTTGSGTSTTITGLAPGTTYTFTVDNGTCTSTTSSNAVVNNVPTPPTATAGAPLVLGCSPTSGPVSVSTTAGATYSWAGPGIVSGGSSPTATVNAVGTYTVTVTDPSTSCSSTATVNVTSNTTPPNVTAGSALTLSCAASSGTISASSTTGGATYSWTGAGIVSGGTTTTPTVNAAGTYTVTVTDPSNGCTATATVTVTNNTTAPNVVAGTTTPISCTTGLGTVSASSTTTGATYSWAGPGVVSGGTTTTPTVNAAGTYTVTVTDPSNGCTATAIVTATNSPGPTANAGTNVTITQGTSTTLTATGGGTYLWTTGETTATITVTPNVTTDYCVTVTDGNGCTDSSCVRITVDIVCGELFVPNAFSPNNDNSNDVFRVKVNPDCVEEIQFYIFDRWGEKVFEATSAEKACVTGWDGNYRGKALDNAVFVYYLNIKLSNGVETQKLKGNVSLIR